MSRSYLSLAIDAACTLIALFFLVVLLIICFVGFSDFRESNMEIRESLIRMESGDLYGKTNMQVTIPEGSTIIVTKDADRYLLKIFKAKDRKPEQSK